MSDQPKTSQGKRGGELEMKDGTHMDKEEKKRGWKKVYNQ